MEILSTFLPFGIFYGHLIYFEVTLVVNYSCFGTLYQEKCGNTSSLTMKSVTFGKYFFFAVDQIKIVTGGTFENNFPPRRTSKSNENELILVSE
jgi:hypothetical protein